MANHPGTSTSQLGELIRIGRYYRHSTSSTLPVICLVQDVDAVRSLLLRWIEPSRALYIPASMPRLLPQFALPDSGVRNIEVLLSLADG